MRDFDDAWCIADAVCALAHVSLVGGGLMHISYVKLFRDDEEINQLKYALEMEMNTVTDLRELLDTVRRIAYELNEEILKDKDAKTEE
jgi:hypothetical protein